MTANPSCHARSGIFHRMASAAGYLVMIVVYAFISLLAVWTLALLEIRQTNVTDFNALIATLDQKDFYRGRYFDTILASIAEDRAQYQSWADSLKCADQTAGGAALAGAAASTPTVAAGGPAKTCPQIRAMVDDHLNALSLLQEDVLFRKANLERYYDQYRDGIRDKDPQLIPVLGLVDSPVRVVALWARMPFELLEMLLLICMGALGGVISVTRCFVDKGAPDPSARDLGYRPAVGAVIALGIYVLFRAAQLFFGAGGERAPMASTSVFLLAALGLASGFCAREAVVQIERAAARLLRAAEEGGDTGKRGAEPETAAGSGAARPAPAAPAAE